MATRSTKTPYELLITRWVHGGQGMGVDADGRIVFVAGTVPGDRARVQPIKVKKRWARAELLEIVEPSPRRVAATCPVQARCGGCPWMVGDASLQAEQRVRILADEIGKVMGPEVAERVAVVDGTPAGSQPAVGYRIRARWAFRRDSSGVLLGYRARRSHRIVPARDCQVVVPELRALNGVIRAAIGDWGAGDIEGEVHVLASAGQTAALVVATDGRTLRIGPERVSVTVADTTLELAPEAFAQANLGVTEEIWRWVRAVAAGAGSGHAVELFAGAGTFTTALRAAGWTVDAYDTAPSQSVWQGATFHASDLLAQGIPLPAPAVAPSLVLLDPPRTGAAELMDWIVGSPATTVVYVSCDLATAVRDAQKLRACGFELRQALSFDMFPHSGHQEVALLLERET